MEKTEKFRQVVVAGSEEGPVEIVITGVDPDAVGAAFGLRHLIHSLTSVRRNVGLHYCGAIGNTQNNALFNMYGLHTRMQPYRGIEGFASDALVALVDSSLLADSRLKHPLPKDIGIVIDHHQTSDIPSCAGSFIWIDPAFGSASTMVTKLLQGFEVDVPSYIATLLALGIYTDTKWLTNVGNEDTAAYQWLRAQSDLESFLRIVRFSLPRDFYLQEAAAIQNMEISNSRLVAGLGVIQPEHADHVAMVADHLSKMQGAAIAVVWAIIHSPEDCFVRFSIRTNDLSLNLAEFLKRRFHGKAGGKLMPDGHGEGGGILELGLGEWFNQTTRPEVERMVAARMKEWFFSA